jgi:TP901 family phage tail tape measure protein
MASIGTINFDVVADVAGMNAVLPEFDNTVNKMESRFKTLGGGLTKAGKAMTKAVSLPAAAVGGFAVKAFADFDSAMVKSQAIMGDLSDEMKVRMSDSAREVARNTTIGAATAAESYFFLASAGMNAEQSIAALPQVAKFAQAGMFDMATATDLATDAQSAIGLKSADASKNLNNLTRVTDVLAKANILANATMGQFSEAIIVAGPEARKMGIEIEELSAMLAVMADQGIKGSQAGTALAFTLPQMAKAARDNADKWKAMNLEIFDASGQMLPFADIADKLTAKFKDMSPEMRSAELAALGLEGRMGRTIGMFIGAGDELRRFGKELNDAAGTVDEIAKQQMESFTAQLKLLKNNIVDLALGIVTEFKPALMSIVDGVGKVVDWFRSLDDSAKKSIAIFVGIAAAIGPVLIVLGTIVTALGSVAAAAPFAAGAIASIAGFIAPVTIAVSALVAAGVVLWQSWKQISQSFQSTTAVAEDMKGTVDGLVSTWDVFTGKINDQENAVHKWAVTWEQIKQLPTFLAIEFEFAFKSMFAAGQAFFSNIAIEAQNQFNFIKAVFKAIGTDGVGVFSILEATAVGMFEGLVERWTAIKDLFAGNISFGEFTDAFSDGLLIDTEAIKQQLATAGIVVPTEIPKEDIGAALAAVQAEKEAALADALAVNLGAVTEAEKKAAREAAKAAGDAAAEQAGQTRDKVANEISKLAGAAEAGSVEAFSAITKGLADAAQFAATKDDFAADVQAAADVAPVSQDDAATAIANVLGAAPEKPNDEVVKVAKQELKESKKQVAQNARVVLLLDQLSRKINVGGIS